MPFKENLKNEVRYKGLQMKDLAFRAGIKKRSLCSYVGQNPRIPSAEAAVRIAQALEVSVEYLVTGNESMWKHMHNHDNPALQSLMYIAESLHDNYLNWLITQARNFRKEQGALREDCKDSAD
jgi:lambda repressor-like predicted transcriptional regulator